MSDAMWGALAIVVAALIASVPAALAARRSKAVAAKVLGAVETGNGKSMAGYVMDTQHAVLELTGHVLDMKRHAETLEERIDRLENRAPGDRPTPVD